MTLKKVERAITGLTIVLGLFIILGFLVFGISEMAGIDSFSELQITHKVWPSLIGMFAVSVALTFALNFAVLSRYFRRFVEEYLRKAALFRDSEQNQEREKSDEPIE